MASAAPTTLLTWPPAVFARSLLNSFGSAAGRAATALAEPTITCPNADPAYWTARTGLAGENTTVGAMPR